jgi:hypothetical protein
MPFISVATPPADRSPALQPLWRAADVPRAGTLPASAFVGRRPEVERLSRMLVAARHGDGQVAAITGPAGIGKTRLAEEVAGVARRRGARVAFGACSPDGEAPPLWPWRTILRQIGAPDDLSEDRAGESGGRFARFLAVLEHLTRPAAGEAPFVVVVDDVHLADPPTLLLCRFLARERRGLPLLLVLTRRDEPRDAEGRELLDSLDREAAVLPLGPLSEEAIGSFLAASGIPASRQDLLHLAKAVTRGNPLHLRSLALQSDLGAGGLRGGLEHAVERLLDQLSRDDRRLLGVAAVLGPEVSAHEVARVAEASPARTAEALDRAARLTLVVEHGDRLAFLHDLVRQVVASALPAPDRMDAHARAAALLSGDDPDALLRKAHHAIRAANRSREDAAAAVAGARQAARALWSADGFEAAAALLGRAVEIQKAAALSGPAAELMTERAEAVQACGRLAEARPLFHRAARLAEAEGDPQVLARAALGLSGVWLAEHRADDEAQRVRPLQRRALEALPAQAAVLRARLAGRLAAEDAYISGAEAPMAAAVEASRRTGDARALAEALSLHHNVLMTPAHTRRRLAVADEAIAAAAAAGDGLRILLGLCWRTADLFLLGDAGARAALAELGVRADALGCRSVLFIARTMEVMLAIRAGRLAEAEKAAEECLALGSEVGDVDALAYHGAHLCAIRFFQGREADLAEVSGAMASSPTLIRRERAFEAAAALFSLRAGNPERARAWLRELAGDGVASLPAASCWLITLMATCEMALALGDGVVAKAAYEALLPYADLPTMGSVAVVCFGSVERSLGIAALALGRLDLAVRHLRAAVAANERLGHRPAAIQARAELALARLRRGASEDTSVAQALLEQALAEGEAAGMGGLVARWREARASVARPAAPAAGPARMERVNGTRWRVAHSGQVAFVRDRIGMRYLAQLVAAPDQTIPVLALVTQGAVAETRRADDVMDRRALAELRGRIRALRSQPDLAPAEEVELAALTGELLRATGLRGRVRSFADPAERARTAVRKAIKRAIEEIAHADAAIGRHLAGQVETGAACCYRTSSAS